MPALSISATRPAIDIEHDVVALELDWLESVLCDAVAPGFLSDPTSFKRFDDAWLRLERLTLALGMPENSADDAAAWAKDFLRRHGRPFPAALTVGTPQYRQRHVAMLWQANMWHEATMVLFGATAIGLLFYAIAQGVQPWM